MDRNKLSTPEQGNRLSLVSSVTWASQLLNREHNSNKIGSIRKHGTSSDCLRPACDHDRARHSGTMYELSRKGMIYGLTEEKIKIVEGG